MYFVLSKTLGEFFAFSNLVFLIVLCGVLLWLSRRFARAGRWITIAGIALIVVGGQSQVSTALLVPLENRFPPWDTTQGAPTGIVVLGGALNTHISRLRKEIALNQSGNRLIAAVELQRQYPAARIIFTGGSSNLIFPGELEAEYAARLLAALGVPDDHVAVDSAARNTFENAVNAKKIANPKPGERWLLVTSASHMPRAIGLFRAAGFPVEAYPVDYRTGGWRDLLSLPTLAVFAGLIRIDPAIHEWAGLVVDWLVGRTPTLLPSPVEATSGAAVDALDTVSLIVHPATDAAK